MVGTMLWSISAKNLSQDAGKTLKRKADVVG